MNKPSLPPAVLIARQEHITWMIWAGFSLAAVALLLFGPQRHPVNESYAFGAECWAKGEPLYTNGGCGFIYPPQAALLHRPFTRLPHPLYELTWRFVNLGLFAAGIYRLAVCCAGAPLTGTTKRTTGAASPVIAGSPGDVASPAAAPMLGVVPVSLFLLMTLITLPKTWTLALNGQATTAMAGLLLLAIADVAERRWWRAAAALLLALAFKPLAIVLLLLLAGLFSPLRWRISAGGLLFLAVPYFARNADYVTAQYVAFIHNLDAANAVGQDMAWPNLFATLHMLGIDVPVSGQLALQIAGALLTLGAGWLVQRRLPAPQAAVMLYSLAASYLLLLNPRTENNSYTLLMPAVAAFAVRELTAEKRLPRLILLFAIVAALTGGFELTRVLTPRAGIVWPCPVACLAFLGLLVAEIAKPLPWIGCLAPRESASLIAPSRLPCSN